MLDTCPSRTPERVCTETTRAIGMSARVSTRTSRISRGPMNWRAMVTDENPVWRVCSLPNCFSSASLSRFQRSM